MFFPCDKKKRDPVSTDEHVVEVKYIQKPYS